MKFSKYAIKNASIGTCPKIQKIILVKEKYFWI